MNETYLASREIESLKAYYAKYADEKYTTSMSRRSQSEVDSIARKQSELFTLDAEWDGGLFGKCSGREKIFEVLRRSTWDFTSHYFLSPILNVDGDAGEGRWQLWQVGRLSASGDDVEIAAVTHDRYSRVNGVWHISGTKLSVSAVNLRGKGWMSGEEYLRERM